MYDNILLFGSKCQLGIRRFITEDILGMSDHSMERGRSQAHMQIEAARTSRYVGNHMLLIVCSSRSFQRVNSSLYRRKMTSSSIILAYGTLGSIFPTSDPLPRKTTLHSPNTTWSLASTITRSLLPTSLCPSTLIKQRLPSVQPTPERGTMR